MLYQQRVRKQSQQYHICYFSEKSKQGVFSSEFFVTVYCLLKEKHTKKETFAKQTNLHTPVWIRPVGSGAVKISLKKIQVAGIIYSHSVPFSFSWAQCTHPGFDHEFRFFFEVGILCSLLGINTRNHCGREATQACCYGVCL